MKPAVTITWAALLGVSYGLVVPTVVTLLRQSLQAAQQIEAYTASILEHASGIERNTAQASALAETKALAPTLLSTAQSMQGHSAAIATALGGPAAGATGNGAGERPDGDAAGQAGGEAQP